MRVALLSDTHNDRQLVTQAAARLRHEGVSAVIHAGDVTNSRTLRLLNGFDLWLARGNMDQDPTLRTVVHQLFGLDRLARVHHLHLDGHRLAVIHDGESPEGLELIRSGEYDYVVHGHTHRPRDDTSRGTRVINPGALGNTQWRRPTFMVLNLSTSDLSLIEL